MNLSFVKIFNIKVKPEGDAGVEYAGDGGLPPGTGDLLPLPHNKPRLKRFFFSDFFLLKKL